MSTELRTKRPPNAFTLIELLVVIAIIALLVGILLPVFSTVRTQARYTQASSQFKAIDEGLNMYRGEAALGGTLPPSASDNPDDRRVIANPRANATSENNGGEDEVNVIGAQLLYHALIGADGLGTPGFRDLDQDGQWWNNTSDAEGMAYYINPDTGQETQPRYGGASGYVDEKMVESAKSLADLVDGNVVVDLDYQTADFAFDEPMFVDPWASPILYYRANPAALRMVTDTEATGTYRQEDNAFVTGSDSSTYASAGLDFGPGLIDGDRYHDLFLTVSPLATVDPEDILIDASGTYSGAFARFILNPKIKARPTAVRRDSYLLISAGPDARYGTEDDVTNWTRGQP